VKRIAAIVKFLPGVVSLHGLLFWLFAVAHVVFPNASEKTPEFIERSCFWILTAPALILARPFHGIFWKFHLMVTAGWFVWPKPIAFVLAYSVWVVVLLVFAWSIQIWQRERNA
jgi:hypothetical protein